MPSTACTRRTPGSSGCAKETAWSCPSRWPTSPVCGTRCRRPRRSLSGLAAHTSSGRSVPTSKPGACWARRRRRTMDSEIARNVAHYSHVGQRTRFDEQFAEHVERVAARVGPEARSLAYLHDVLERTATPLSELWDAGRTAT